MEQLDQVYNSSQPVERSVEMHTWLRYIFSSGDLDEDGEIDLKEFLYLSSADRDKRWKEIEEGEDYSEAEWERYKKEKLDMPQRESY